MYIIHPEKGCPTFVFCHNNIALKKFTIINKKHVEKIRPNFYFCSQGIDGMLVASLIATREGEQGLSFSIG